MILSGGDLFSFHNFSAHNARAKEWDFKATSSWGAIALFIFARKEKKSMSWRDVLTGSICVCLTGREFYPYIQQGSFSSRNSQAFERGRQCTTRMQWNCQLDWGKYLYWEHSLRILLKRGISFMKAFLKYKFVLLQWLARKQRTPLRNQIGVKIEHTKKGFIVELPNAHVIYMTSNLAIFTHVQDVRTMQNARAGRLE